MTGHSQTLEIPYRVSNVVELLRTRAQHEPERCAFTFLVDGDAEGPSLTFGEIDRRARAVAATLQQEGIAGEQALLLYPPGLPFVPAFYGTLYAGAVAVTAPMPVSSRIARTLPRLEAVVKDAAPKVALTTSEAMAEIEKLLASSPVLRSVRWLVTDAIPPDAAEAWREPDIDPQTLAFLQYTSGSTASPRGVMVSHRNLLHNSECIRLRWRYTPESVSVMWVPHIHDHGLVDGIVQPVYTGFRSILLPNLSVMQQPVRWLRAITRYKATHSGGPNFSYDLCVRKIAREQLPELDLRNWITAVNAAEPIRKETLVRFGETFGPCGFRWSTFFPAFGLAESTLVVSARHAPVFRTLDQDALLHHRVREAAESAGDTVAVAGCGRPMPDTTIAIVDPETRIRCAPDEVGEIWVSSPSVAGGYWNRPEETAAVFNAFVAATGEGPFMRTGDLGFLKEGELFVTGRRKDLIIVRGNNHYPQDIEYTVERSHPALRAGCGAAFSFDANGEERVVVVVEVAGSNGLDPQQFGAIKRAIRKAVSEGHDLGVYAVELLKTGTIPKTSSGKIQRSACRAGFLNRNLETLEESA
jgi:acyl-CoA synthetase (AMP-forming)/AMP-acid ligase II